MKWDEYPLASAMTDDMTMMMSGDDGTKRMSMEDALYEMLHEFGMSWVHRMIPRGKNLGTSLTSVQRTAIREGTFDDLWIGDYWVINSVTWRIMDIDYWYHQGDTSCTDHHIVVMPDGRLYTAAMNSSNTTAGGYLGSEMYTSNLADAKSTVNSAFGSSYILSHREYLTNAVTSGYPSGGEWCDSTVELPNEEMMYGSMIKQQTSSSGTNVSNATVSTQQLALIQAAPYFKNPSRQTNWLRDIVSASSFAHVNSSGAAHYYGASNAHGVRPVFGICG